MKPPKEGIRASLPGDYELRSTGGASTLTGHFAVFNQWTEINSRTEGHFRERIAPGAFKKTLREGRNRIRVLFDHGVSHLGSMVLGKVRDLEEDSVGVRYADDLFDGVPDLLVNGLKAGEYGSSFRFQTVQEDFDPVPARTQGNPDGIPERTLKEVRLLEFGPVAFPAYAGATASLRSPNDELIPGPPVARERDVPSYKLENPWYLGDRPDWDLE